MEAQVRTAQTVFMHPQRLVVSLFQRPCVCNEENQWQPILNDVVRLTDRLLRQPRDKHFPHFLGAVLLEQVQNPAMKERTIMAGQQRMELVQHA